jgi:hypothetical protein
LKHPSLSSIFGKRRIIAAYALYYFLFISFPNEESDDAGNLRSIYVAKNAMNGMRVWDLLDRSTVNQHNELMYEKLNTGAGHMIIPNPQIIIIFS